MSKSKTKHPLIAFLLASAGILYHALRHGAKPAIVNYDTGEVRLVTAENSAEELDMRKQYSYQGEMFIIVTGGDYITVRDEYNQQAFIAPCTTKQYSDKYSVKILDQSNKNNTAYSMGSSPKEAVDNACRELIAFRKQTNKGQMTRDLKNFVNSLPDVEQPSSESSNATSQP